MHPRYRTVPPFSQSYQRGIETPVKSLWLGRKWALNRTNVELKLPRLIFRCFSCPASQSYQRGIETELSLLYAYTNAPLNRTNVELKLLYCPLPRSSVVTLNRTNVELKHIYPVSGHYVHFSQSYQRGIETYLCVQITETAATLNRTNVELKLLKSTTRTG